MSAAGRQGDLPVRAGVRIESWGEGDLPLLRKCLGDSAMMQHLGGPESAEKIAERQTRYQRPDSKQFKILDEASGEGVGWVGYWPRTTGAVSRSTRSVGRCCRPSGDGESQDWPLFV